MRLAKKLDGWSRAAIGRRLGEAVVGGKDLMSAVVGVFEELQTAPGQVIPIGKLEDVNRKEVSIEGQVEVLWDADSPAIAQVGLIADDSGKTKVTIWRNQMHRGSKRASRCAFTRWLGTGTRDVSHWP